MNQSIFFIKSNIFKSLKRVLFLQLSLALLLNFVFYSPLISQNSQDTVRVKISTEMGDILMEIYPKAAPITANNFLKYVESGYYERGTFYRAVKSEESTDSVKIGVVQGGLFKTYASEKFPNIEHETTKKTGILHKNGTVSMARLEVGTAHSEFFICVGDQPELDFGGKRNPDGQGFAAFGQVVEGMETVLQLQQQKGRSNGMMWSPIKFINVEIIIDN